VSREAGYVSFLTCSKISRISSVGAKHKVRYVSRKAHHGNSLVYSID
jgi:hypothetical protein